MNLKSQNTPNEDVIEFMRNRRSVPAKFMGGPGPDETQLAVILEIASRVPDHGKLAPWRFIRYSADKCKELGEQVLKRAIERSAARGKILSDDFVEIERNRFLRAPVVVAVVSCAETHPKIPEWEQIMSSGAVAMNMLIAANAFGYDAQWLTEWLAFDDELRDDLGLRDGEKISGFIHMGTRKNPKSERDRPKLDEIYTIMEANS